MARKESPRAANDVITAINRIDMVLRAVVTDLVERDPTMKERVLYKLQAMRLAPFSSDEQKALEHSIKYFESLYVAPNPKLPNSPKE